MNHQNYIFNHLAGIFHTGVFCLKEERLISYEENPEYNPIYNNEVLRNTLAGNADVQKEPVIVSDDFHMFYVCVKWESGGMVSGGMTNADCLLMVKVTATDLNICRGAGTNTAKTGKYTSAGVFTIVEVRSGKGSDKGWGKLKSGAGWIALDHCQRV